MKKFFRIIFITLFLSCPLEAEIITDGHLGQAIALEGPRYPIEAHLGQQFGNNLFYSFQEFNLNNGEQAIFSGPETVNTLISRVTGGHPSTINGLLRSTLPNADFYFINPYGLTFGPGAQLDIQGAFHASTADSVYFQDGGEFNARHPSQSLLTTAPISAFGFLTATPATLTVTGTQLEVHSTATLSLTGGDIDVNQATLRAPAGHLILASFAQAGEMALEPFSAPTAQGPITFEHAELSAVGGGYIGIRGGQFKFIQSHMSNDNISPFQSEAIELKAQDIHLDASRITSTSWESGAAGAINIQATGNLKLSGLDAAGQGSFIAANARGGGDGGRIDIQAQQLQLLEGAKIGSLTVTEARGGHIQITADHLLLAGEDQRFPSMITTSTRDQGAGGNININAGELQLRDGALIFADTAGSGRGGNIQLSVKNLAQLSGASQDGFVSAISASSHSLATNAGQGGSINLKAGQLQLTRGAQMRADTFGAAAGGNIAIEIDAMATLSDSGIFATSEAQGDAGLIVLAVGQYMRLEDSAIKTSAVGADGGNIRLKTLNYVYLTESEISTSVNQDFGNGGNINLTHEFIILDKSHIIAQAQKGRGGNINITTTGIYNFSQQPLEQVINASSEFGVDGVVAISTPENHVDEDVVILSSRFLQVEQLRSLCRHFNFGELPSSFTVTSLKGARLIPSHLQPSL